MFIGSPPSPPPAHVGGWSWHPCLELWPRDNAVITLWSSEQARVTKSHSSSWSLCDQVDTFLTCQILSLIPSPSGSFDSSGRWGGSVVVSLWISVLRQHPHLGDFYQALHVCTLELLTANTSPTMSLPTRKRVKIVLSFKQTWTMSAFLGLGVLKPIWD